MQDPKGTGHDPGDAVPPGIAAETPAPLSAHDIEVKRKLEQLGRDTPPRAGEAPQ